MKSQQCFSVAGPILENSLPFEIQSVPTLLGFRKLDGIELRGLSFLNDSPLSFLISMMAILYLRLFLIAYLMHCTMAVECLDCHLMNRSTAAGKK